MEQKTVQVKISKYRYMPRFYQMIPKGWFNQGWQPLKDLRILKWYKINGRKTLTLIWNWTHRLYESWHLHMRKLHMADQSFSLTWSISTFTDLRILCLPTDTHSSSILGTLLKAHTGNMFCRFQAWISSCCMDLGAGFGEGSAHICFMTVSITVSRQVRAALMVAQGLKVQVQHPPAVFLLQGNNVDITPAEVYIHQTVANYFELMWASQCQWGYLIHQTPAARNYSWFPYPGDN